VVEKKKKTTPAEDQIQRLETLRLENERQVQKKALKAHETPRTAVERTIERLDAMREMASQSGPAMPPVIFSESVPTAPLNDAVVVPPSGGVVSASTGQTEAVAPTLIVEPQKPIVPQVTATEGLKISSVPVPEKSTSTPARLPEEVLSPEEALRAVVERWRSLKPVPEPLPEPQVRPVAPSETSESVVLAPPPSPLPPTVDIPEPLWVTPPVPPPMPELDPTMEDIEEPTADETQTVSQTTFARFEGRFKNVKLSAAQMKVLEQMFEVDPRLYPARILRLALNQWLEMPNLAVDEALEPLSRDALVRIKKGL
jgi:hypothetical protein